MALAHDYEYGFRWGFSNALARCHASFALISTVDNSGQCVFTPRPWYAPCYAHAPRAHSMARNEEASDALAFNKTVGKGREASSDIRYTVNLQQVVGCLLPAYLKQACSID